MSNTLPHPLSTSPMGTLAANSSYELTLLLDEIEHLAVTEEPDDDEALPPAHRDSIERARDFVAHLYQTANATNEPLVLPSAFAARDGSVQLFWKAERWQTLLTFRPNKQTIEIGLKKPEEPSSRQEISAADALEYARLAMCRQSLTGE